jgi:hypothetical protein
MKAEAKRYQPRRRANKKVYSYQQIDRKMSMVAPLEKRLTPPSPRPTNQEKNNAITSHTINRICHRSAFLSETVV